MGGPRPRSSDSLGQRTRATRTTSAGGAGRSRAEFLAWLAVPPGRPLARRRLRHRRADRGGARSPRAGARSSASSPPTPSAATPRTQVPDPRASFLRRATRRRSRSTTAPFDVVVSGLVLNFVPDRPAALAEMRRAARPGGTVAAYVWDYAGEMQLMRALLGRPPSRSTRTRARLDEAARFAFCRPGPAARAVRGRRAARRRGRGDRRPDRLRATSTTTGRRSSAAPGRRRRTSRRWARAPDPRCGTPSAHPLPTADDGSIHLTARAWAVRGTA